jgi:hypothetical protein
VTSVTPHNISPSSQQAHTGPEKQRDHKGQEKSRGNCYWYRISLESGKVSELLEYYYTQT